MFTVYAVCGLPRREFVLIGRANSKILTAGWYGFRILIFYGLKQAAAINGRSRLNTTVNSVDK